MKAFYTIGLLILSNTFMTLAWYGHLKFKELNWFQNAGIITPVLLCWGIAVFEFFFRCRQTESVLKEMAGRSALCN